MRRCGGANDGDWVSISLNHDLNSLLNTTQDSREVFRKFRLRHMKN